MRKLTTLLVFTLVGMVLNAQSNLFEELAKYEGQQYVPFLVEHGEKKLKFEKQEYMINVQAVKDNYGKGIGVSMNVGENHDSFKDHRYDPRYDRIDHYKEPAYCRSVNSDRDAFVMIDGLLFKLLRSKESLNSFEVGYSYVYVPKSIAEAPVAENKEDSGKKKGKFKSFLKAVGEVAVGTTFAEDAPAFLKSIETEELFKAKIASYLAEMRKKQEANPLNAEDKKRWQEVIDMKKKAEDELAEYNRKFYASEEGQAQLKRLEENRNRDRARCQFTVKNVGTQSVKYTTDRSVFNISAGSSQKFDCGKTVYRSNSNGDKLSVIGGGDSSFSGRTITVE